MSGGATGEAFRVTNTLHLSEDCRLFDSIHVSVLEYEPSFAVSFTRAGGGSGAGKQEGFQVGLGIEDDTFKGIELMT